MAPGYLALLNHFVMRGQHNHALLSTALIYYNGHARKIGQSGREDVVVHVSHKPRTGARACDARRRHVSVVIQLR
jgi:hypothetical protein